MPNHPTVVVGSSQSSKVTSLGMRIGKKKQEIKTRTKPKSAVEDVLLKMSMADSTSSKLEKSIPDPAKHQIAVRAVLLPPTSESCRCKTQSWSGRRGCVCGGSTSLHISLRYRIYENISQYSISIVCDTRMMDPTGEQYFFDLPLF